MGTRTGQRLLEMELETGKLLNRKGRWFNPKVIIMLGLLIGIGYLITKVPYETVLILGIALIILIGIWVFNARKEHN